MKAIFVLLMMFVFGNIAWAQNVDDDTNVGNNQVPTGERVQKEPIREKVDGIYDKTHVYNRTPVSYVHLREADVMWSKTVWRRIDLREKINHPLHFPNLGDLTSETTQGNWLSFWDVLYSALDSTERNPNPLMIYTDQWCNIPQYFSEFKGKLGTKKKMPQFDDDGVIIGEIEFVDPYKKSDFLALDIKEMWFFDKQRSVLDVRIIAIEPLFYVEDPTAALAEKFRSDEDESMDEDLVDKLFMGAGWLYFSEIRPVLASNDAFNVFNTAERRSYEDFFWKRMFSSFVLREENIYNNREINQFLLNGLDQVLESDRITNEIRKFEHDMWDF